MKQMSFFNMVDPQTIRKKIAKRYKRLEGESREEFRDFLRIETDYTVSQIITNHPSYENQNIQEKDLIKFSKIFLSIKFKNIL